MRQKMILMMLVSMVGVICYGGEKKVEMKTIVGGSVKLYDTTKSVDMGEQIESFVDDKWKEIAEGNKPDTFGGDVVMVNGRLGILIKKDGKGIELYARTVDGWKRRARLSATGEGQVLKGLGMKVVANDNTEVGVRVSLGGNRGIVFTLGAADPMVKVMAEGKVERLRIESPCRFGVLPDFFADDLLVDAVRVPVERVEVPSDNFFLHMVGEGESIVAAVWEKNVHDVELSFSGEKANRRIVATDVFYGDGGSNIWVAVLEEKGIWYWEELTKAESENGKTLERWVIPFMAKWKANFVRSDGTVSSAPLVTDKGAYAFAGMRYPQHNHFLKKSGNGYTAVLVPESKLAIGAMLTSYYDGPMVAYPIARFDTPIDRLTVEDLLARALGSGPCAYVLDVEAATPKYVGIFTCSYGKTPGMFIPAGPKFDYDLRAAETWKEDRAFMKRETRGVAAFIKYIQDRINTYVDLTLDLLKYLDEAEKKYPQQSEFIGRLRNTLKEPTQVFQKKVNYDVRANGEQIFKPWMDEMMKAMRIDTPEQARKGFAAARAPEIGDPQDARVAGLRRKMKIVRSMATMEMTRNPGAVEIAKEIRKRIEQALRNPSNYERETQWVSGGS